MMNTVEVRGAVKHYRTGREHRVVLNQLNMTVSSGSIYALLGASGCGKTTLLSCILGMVPLDDGKISVFGNISTKHATKVNGSRIGYMPQEMALIGELTIKETIYHFGNIFQMDIDKLRDRYEMLHKLLELPYGDQRVESCSGGQKRRISFATAMIHEPDLLILDEPTVGLDPVLREKIWDFMINVTTTSKLSIIITTHYIEEARQANCVGLMRNGVLLAEDKPICIMNQMNVDNLEEAFLALCLKRGVSEDAGELSHIETNSNSNNNNNDNATNELEMNANCQKSTKRDKSQTKFNSIPEESKSNKFRWQIVRALFVKNALQLKRQPAAIILVTFLPLFQLFLFYHALGGNPKGLKIGIVDSEIIDYDECDRSTLISTFPHDYTCDLNLISCRFLDEITDDTAIKVFYSSFEEALKDAKRGELIGIIKIDTNFTESLELVRKNPKEADEGSKESSVIKVYLDQADLQLTFFIQRRIFEIYKNYSQSVLSDCKMPLKLDNVPMDFSETLFGSINADFRHTMLPPFTMLILFVLAAGLTLSGIVMERKEGFWNRTLLAGVSTFEILSAHVIINVIIVTMQLIEILTLLTIIYGSYNIEGYFIVTLMLAILGCCGILFGLWISCLCSELMQANLLMTGITQPMTALSGMIWPVEGMPLIIRIISYATPTTWPSRAMREVIEKGYTFTHPNVLIAFANLFAWLLLTFYLGMSSLKKSKYSRNT